MLEWFPAVSQKLPPGIILVLFEEISREKITLMTITAASPIHLGLLYSWIPRYLTRSSGISIMLLSCDMSTDERNGRRFLCRRCSAAS